MEELVLTDPVVVPEKVTDKYKVRTVLLDWQAESLDVTGAYVTGLVSLALEDNHGGTFTHAYFGNEAIDLMKFLNTANFSVNSMHKRILQKLSNDGVLPGTVTGAPDPASEDA